MTRNINEPQEELEKEFSEFLTQKINLAGGSLQFQHLSGLLQQVRFEIRDAFGVTKSALMKFLKARPKCFKVDSKGIVTIVNPSILDNENCYNAKENKNPNCKTFLSEIKNGTGSILKFTAHYAIVKARSPITTYVFFTPLEYGGGKDGLFTDFDLHVGNRVGFTAIHGHSDYEIEYRAIKVWRIQDSDEEDSYPQNLERKNLRTKKYTGEGVIKKLLPNIGFISISGKQNQEILFYRVNIKDHNIKLKDKVEFVAEYISNEWQATNIIKKQKEKMDLPSDLSQACSRSADKSNVKRKITNETGIIYPCPEGAVIKFGKNYSEVANGNACNFYWYDGVKLAVSDIAVEFSEGDEVKFDAVKSKGSSEWKAILAWVGDKPTNVEIDKKIFIENDESSEEDRNSVDPDKITSSGTSDLRSKKKKHKYDKVNPIPKGYMSDNKRFDSPIGRNFNRSPNEHNLNNIVASQISSQKLPTRNYTHNLNKGRRRHRNRGSNKKDNQRQIFTKHYKKSDDEGNFDEEKNFQDEEIFERNKDADVSESNDSTSEENNELQNSPKFFRKFLKEDKQSLMNIARLQTDSEDDSSDKVASVKGNPFIKKFEAIDGEIVNLYCKVAIIKSNCLSQTVDFILNAFYVNGKSVEEQLVDDLKEVIKVGDIVKFNCFEIMDDSGEIHRKVTMAWIGPKPEVHEIKPEDFISEQELHVTLAPEYEYESNETFDTGRITDFDDVCELNSDAESLPNDRLDETSHQHPESSNKITNNDEYKSDDIPPENLPEKILKKLKTYGFSSSEPELALNVVQEIIELVLRNSDIEKSSVSSLSQESETTACSFCGNANKPLIKGFTNSTEAEVQTISTGEIQATSICPDL